MAKKRSCSFLRLKEKPYLASWSFSVFCLFARACSVAPRSAPILRLGVAQPGTQEQRLFRFAESKEQYSRGLIDDGSGLIGLAGFLNIRISGHPDVRRFESPEICKSGFSDSRKSGFSEIGFLKIRKTRKSGFLGIPIFRIFGKSENRKIKKLS